MQWFAWNELHGNNLVEWIKSSMLGFCAKLLKFGGGKLKSVELADRWRQISQDDFEMTEIARQNGKFLHAAFCAQQAVEKALKGIYVLNDLGQPPYTHDLVRLAEAISGIQDFGPNVLATFSALNPFYIRARYPDYKRMLEETLDDETIAEFQQCAQGVLKCLQDSASEQMKKLRK